MEDNAESLLSFFGLSEQPFAATADPAYFYATSAHKECLFRLWHAVDERHGISVVLGNYGTGKTTLLRKLIAGMRANPEKYNTAVIASPIPSWTSFSLLEAIVHQFGLRPEDRSFATYMDALYQYLATNRGRIHTLIIDDAQNLNKRGQLELLRLAQNLETPQHKLLNLVFYSQLEWTAVLQAAPNFGQRISMTYTLDSLSVQDTQNLIDFRMRQATVPGMQPPVFDAAGVRLIHAYAEGSPRVSVTLCRNALLLAYQLRTRRIGQAIILHTIQKTTLPDHERRSRVAALVAEPPVPSIAEFDFGSDDSGMDTVVRRRTYSLQTARANRMLLNAARGGLEVGVRAFAEFDGAELR